MLKIKPFLIAFLLADLKLLYQLTYRKIATNEIVFANNTLAITCYCINTGKKRYPY